MFFGIPIVLIAIMLQLTYVCTQAVLLAELVAVLAGRTRGWKLYSCLIVASAAIGGVWQSPKVGWAVLLAASLVPAPVRAWLFVKGRCGGLLEKHVFYRFCVFMCAVVSIFLLPALVAVAIRKLNAS